MASLLKTSTLNAVGLAVRMLGGLLTNKLIAVVAGPGGIALYGQFQSLATLLIGFTAAPGQSGVVRLTAANQGDLPAVYPLWSAALRTVLLFSLVAALLGMACAPLIARDLLEQPALAWPVAIFFLCMPAATVMTLLLSCANGLSDIRAFVLAGVVTTISASLLVVVGVLMQGISGAILATGLGQIVSLLLTYACLRREPWFALEHFRLPVVRSDVRRVLGLASMTFAAAAVAPLMQLSIRHFMSGLFGWQVVGYWQAVSRLGDIYVMLVTSLLSVYYLPRFSAIKALPELRREVASFFKIVYPLFLLGYVCILVLKSHVLTAVYSSAFLPAAKLFPVQMASDAVRVLSWLVGYLVMARGGARFFVSIEILVGALVVALAVAFMHVAGYGGVLYASLLGNILYTGIFTVYLLRNGLL